ncbi:MAG: hypothetical protein LBL58_18640 [Tannerellaceae bacterium]|jgi:hypothetical protein|nr:hypothetical protein [Tannerellaceae bacterium]
MKTVIKLTCIIIGSFLFVGSLVAQEQTKERKYARLIYMDKGIELDRNFFIMYNEIYEANIGKLDKPKNRSKWDAVNTKIINYLLNPAITVKYNEAGKISFSPRELIELDGVYEKKKKQEKDENKKAAQIYATILPATISLYVKRDAERSNAK